METASEQFLSPLPDVQMWADQLAQFGFALIALIAIVVAWRSESLGRTMAWTWMGTVLLTALSVIIRRFIDGGNPDELIAMFQFIIIGWFPGVLILIVVLTCKRLYEWIGSWFRKPA